MTVSTRWLPSERCERALVPRNRVHGIERHTRVEVATPLTTTNVRSRYPCGEDRAQRLGMWPLQQVGRKHASSVTHTLVQ